MFGERKIVIKGHTQVIEAEQVFLLMKENLPVSRNARGTWFLQHLNKNIDSDQLHKQEEITDGEFQVVSVLPKHVTRCQYRITQRTVVTFLAKHYKLAFVLDISPSVASVDIADGCGNVLYNEIYKNLQLTLQFLVKPFQVPGSDLKLCPNLHVTVLAHSPLIACQACQVLIQGCLVTEENVDSILHQVRRGLDAFEDESRKSLYHIIDAEDVVYEDDDLITGSLFEDVNERPQKPDINLNMITPEVGLITMLRYGILTLQLLPEYSSSGIVVLTDGVSGLTDAILFESVMTQLRHSTICCSFILCLSDFSENSNLGKIPHTELLQFIATATFGAYFSKIPVIDCRDENSAEMNVFHKAILTWSFHRALEGFKIDDYIEAELFDTTESLVSSVSRKQSSTLLDQIGNPPFLKKKHTDRNLHINISHLISCRLREGYTIKDVVFSKGESQIEVKLVLPWRDFARILYAVTSAWPLTSAKRHSHVEVTVEACYEFLHDVTCVQKKTFRSPFRMAVVKKYWQILQGMSETDQLLVHLQSFASNQIYYNLPESVKQKIPLFYLPTNSGTPQVNFQLNTKDTTVDQFTNFWRLVLMLDVNIWQKWMHSHKIVMLLEHDRPLGKHLHIPNASGKFHNVLCRQAQLAVNEFLKNFCTFMLMENHSYIKLLFDDTDKPPTSFYIIRVSSKAPCLVLRIAFLGGTSGKLRHQIIHDLEESLAGLSFPPRGTASQSGIKLEDEQQLSQLNQKLPPPLQRSWSHIPCCIITKKPVEKLLIRYDKLPKDFNNVSFTQIPSDPSGHVTVSANKVASSTLFTLSKYLYHRRWIYSVQHGTSMPITTQAIGRILSNVTKVRLQEGFHFSQTHSGVINMLLEVDMKNPDDNEETGLNRVSPCVVQYIVFPPHTTTVRENHLDDDYHEDTTEADGELQVITECWVEPQYGEIVNSSPQRKHFDGLTYTELPDAMYPTDLECISTMITFEHLNLMCHSVSVPSPALNSPSYAPPLLSPCLNQGRSTPPLDEAGVQHIAFPFDLLRILPKCQQVELLFSTLKQDMLAVIQEFTQLQEKSDHTKSSDDTKDEMTSSTHFPNDALFKFFMDYLNHIHDREIQLTDFQCEQLVPLLKQRDRDLEQHPYPFNFDCKNSEEELDIGEEATGIGGTSRRGSSLSVLTNYSVGSCTTNQSQVPSQSSQSYGVSSPIMLQTGNISTKKTVLTDQCGSTNSDSKATLGQIGKNVSSGSDSKHSHSGFSGTSSSGRGTGFGQDSKPLNNQSEANYPTQISSTLLSHPTTSQIPYCPIEDGSKPTRITSTAFSPNHLNLSQSLDRKKENISISRLYSSKRIPNWRCFVKSITSTYVIMSFVPASYADLLLLSEGTEALNQLANVAKQIRVETKHTEAMTQKHSSEYQAKQESLFKQGKNGDKVDSNEVPYKTSKNSSTLSTGEPLNLNASNRGTKDEACPISVSKSNEKWSEKSNSTLDLNKEDSSQAQSLQENERQDNESAHKISSGPETVNNLPSPILNNVESNITNLSQVPSTTDNDESCDEHKPDYNRSVTLPVYIYNCPLGYLTDQIVNKWTCNKPGDIYEDLHFTTDDYNQQDSFTQSNEVGDDPDKRKHKKTLSESEKWHLGASEKITGDIYGNQTDLQQHCTLVSETFFRSFVNGVFQSLQHGKAIDINDVESAINTTCEEALPLEIDITKFLLTGCGHTRQIIEKVNINYVIQEDLKKTFPGIILSNKNEESNEETQQSVDVGTEESTSTITSPSVSLPQQHPKLAVRFPLALLNSKSTTKSCGEYPGLHRHIKQKVHLMLSRYFTPVPRNPEYLFYHPPDLRPSEQDQEDMDISVRPVGDTSMEETTQDENKQKEMDSDEENYIFYCEKTGKSESTAPGNLNLPVTPSVLDLRDPFDGYSVQSNKDSLSIGSEELDDLVNQAGYNNQAPLFIQLMCSVRRKNSHFKSVQIEVLPTCLGELKDCLGGEENTEIDLNDIQITLDLICLTLPPEIDLTETTKRPCYQRMTSQISYSSSIEDDIDVMSHPTTTDFGLAGDTIGDPLKDLSVDQHDAVIQCRDQINWLLQDEVASSMRQIFPVTADTLQMVAKHVQMSVGHQMCFKETVQLQFVYGAEQSSSHFIEDFQKMNLPGYHLKKEGDFYYLYIDRAVKALSDALNNRLYNLNERSPTIELKEGEGVLRCPHLSDSLSLDLTSGSRERSRVPTGEKTDHELPNVTKTSTPQRSEECTNKLAEIKIDSTPSSPERHLVRQKAIEEKDKPPLLTKDSQLSDTSVFQSEEKVDNIKPRLSVDDSIEVLIRGSEVSRIEEYIEKGHMGEVSCTEGDKGNQQPLFRAESIKISVTRPSPSREVPTNINYPKEQNEESKDTDVSDGDNVIEEGDKEERSRHSTGSSIQVIEEQYEEEDYREENLDAAIQEGKDMNTTVVDSSSNSSVNGEDKITLPGDKEKILSGNGVRLSPTEQACDNVQVISSVNGISSKINQSTDTFPQPPELRREILTNVPSLFSGTTPAKAINIISQHNDGLLPDNRVDPFSKSVHFLKHQSPDTRALDMAAFMKADMEKVAREPKRIERSVSVKDVKTRYQSPLTVASPPIESTDKKNQIKRAHSSASFEKYKADFEGIKQQQSLTHHRRASQSGRVTPARSRHHSGQSGLRTPLSSVFDVSSRGSYGEEGYDGDSSDTEDGTLLSFSDALVQRHSLPNFWLILKIGKDYVDVFFHSRDRVEDEVFRLHNKQYNLVLSNIKSICRSVNQKLLLEELYKTRMCNSLLVPEADEDVRWWKNDKLHSSAQRRKVERSDSEDSEPDGNGNYLAASMHIGHGHFACDRVWNKLFILHPRLKTAQGRPIISRGLQCMKMVMQKFSVNNRKNMFVIKETNTGNVFYLKLIETPMDSKEIARLPEEETALSRSSSVVSLTRKPSEPEDIEQRTLKRKKSFIDPEDEVAMVTGSLQRTMSFSSEKEPDLVSLTSRGSAFTSSMRGIKGQDTVSLVAHGICDVGSEINRDLVQLIQKKLDDAVLDVMSDILTRNPKCKLTTADVQFIQAPLTEPSDIIRFNVPACALLHQYALGYYLRQNLQGDAKLLFTPKYMDNNKAEGMFCDYTQPEAPTIAENDIFLYNRPHQSGGKGLACIQLSFVDGNGKAINLLGTPKPAPQTYKDPLDHAMFEGLVEANHFDTETPKGFGIIALVRFQIWKRGDVDVAQLVEKLQLAMKYSLCDLVCEYRLLTAPICDIPQHYLRGIDSPLHSAPTSPALMDKDNTNTTSHNILKKQLSVLPEKSTKEKTAFSFQSITEMFKPNTTTNPGTPKADKAEKADEHTTWLEVESQRRKEAEIRHKIMQYESGERGHLTPIFAEILTDWFHFCSQLGCPSIQKYTYMLSHRSPADYILKEIKTIVNNICPDTTTKIFMKCQDMFIPYVSAKSQTDSKETHMNQSSKRNQSPFHRRIHFVVVARSLKQWRDSIDYGYKEAEVEPGSLLNSSSRGSKNMQKFKPLEPGVKVRLSAETLTSTCETYNPDHYVPRQRLLLIHFIEKQLTVYTYNWANDANTSLDRQLDRVVSWHNARQHLLTCIVSQKMGLFQHHLFGEVSPRPLPQEQNPFLQNSSDVDVLVKYTSPVPAVMQLKALNNKPGGTRPAPPHLVHHPAIPMLDELFRDTSPAIPLHRSHYGNLTDPLHRHGAQMLELKAMERKGRERMLTLEKVYLMWQQRTGSSHMPIDTDTLTLLKLSSRLVHTVSTPLLFSPKWRKNILADCLQHTGNRNEVQASQSGSKPRSRHGSGASIKSRRSGSFEGKRSVVTESPDFQSRQQSTDLEHEEAWHAELRTQYMEHYIEYIHSLGFSRVTIRPSIDPRKGMRKQKENKYCYLQRTLPGGIMLIEIGFSSVHFGVHVYALECSRIPVGRNVNRHLEVIFTDECDRFKDLTHVHSFTHDFHLRMVQACISNQQVFKPGYNLTAFLRLFTTYFSYVPSFARNYVYEGTMKIERTNSAGQHLFEYMRTHDKSYGMRALEMNVQLFSDDTDVIQETEYALLSQHKLVSDEETDLDSDNQQNSYMVGVVLAHDPPSGSKVFELERTSLHLRYWVIVTNEKEKFPIDKLEQKLGMMKVAQIFPATQLLPSKSPNAVFLDQYDVTGSEEGEAIDIARPSQLPQKVTDEASTTPKLTPAFSIKKVIGVRQDVVNYLGYSITHQTPMYSRLLKEAKTTKCGIRSMVENAMVRCRRDTLWQRMLLNTGYSDEVSSGRRRHKTAWVELEDRDPLLQRLSFSEFEELMKIVSKTALYELDPSLIPLHNMPLSWYQGLVKVFINKYGDGYRHFSSSDNLVQHLVLPNIRDVDMFMMVTIDAIGNKNELCAVFRKEYINDLISQTHLEAFVNTCCYHLWAGVV